MNDERHGLPSASKLARLIHCPGSEALIQQVMAVTKGLPQSNAAATFGTQIHAGLAGEDVDLTAYQDKIKEECLEVYKRLEKKLVKEPLSTLIESRCWISGDDGEEAFSARLDRASTNGKGTWLVADFKTLPGEQDEAPDNWQILGCCACLFDDAATRMSQPIEDVYGAIIQPSITKDPVPVRFTSRQLRAARRQILDAVEASRLPDAPRIPGAWCKFCSASSNCLEAQSLMPIMPSGSSVELLSPAKLRWIWERLPAIKDVVEQVEARMKALVHANPDAFPDLTVEERPGKRAIKDAQGAFVLLKDYVNKDLFKSMMTVPVGKLQDAFCESYATANNCTKQDAVRVFDRIIKPVVQSGKPSFSLMRKPTQ